MVDYTNGKIYKIWSPSQDIQYIGSTTQSLTQRLAGHRKNFKLHFNPNSTYHHYLSSFDVLKYDDHRIDLLENYSCNNRMELLQKEGEHIKNNICVNKTIAGRTRKEYREDNKEKILKQEKKYRELNKEKLLKRGKIYRENTKELRKVKTHCVCNSIVRKSDFSRHLKTLKHKKYLDNL